VGFLECGVGLVERLRWEAKGYLWAHLPIGGVWVITSRFGNLAVASLVKTMGSFQPSNFYLYCPMHIQSHLAIPMTEIQRISPGQRVIRNNRSSFAVKVF